MPPLPFSLSTLKKEANSKFNLSAQDVLLIAQSLYEKKLTSYPRSDCQYLPEEQFKQASQILLAIKTNLAQHADPMLKSKAWDTKKITAHHAIIPTGNFAEGLTAKEQNLYNLICQNYCLQFFEPLKYEATKVILFCEETTWQTNGRVVLQEGFTQYLGVNTSDEASTESDDQSSLPKGLKENALCSYLKSQIVPKKTSPPAYFTEGTLIEAMANIHRFIDDEEAKKVLKDNKGIGTEATRANIIETLKSRSFIEAKNKKIVSTPAGRELIDLTPTALKDPVLTAQWETKLAQIVSKEYTLEKFMQEQEQALNDKLLPLIETIRKKEGERLNSSPKCKICGKPMFEKKGKSKTGKPYHFMACSGYPECKSSYNL